LRSACAEEAASSTTNETMPKNFGDITKGTLLCAGPAGEPLYGKSERHVQTGAGASATPARGRERYVSLGPACSVAICFGIGWVHRLARNSIVRSLIHRMHMNGLPSDV
jgi:hypothetical protein